MVQSMPSRRRELGEVRVFMSTVSVIIPAYNQADYLAPAVQSALDQTHADVEVIIVDDGSTDHTSQVAQSFTDPRVCYVYQVNRGLSGARNTGIRHATGRYLTYLDSDDLFLPEKIAILLAEIERHPRSGFVAGQAVPIDEEGQSIGKLFDKGLPVHLPDLLLGNPLHVGSVLVSRDWQERVGFFDETLRSYEDWDMWLRLALAGCPMACVAQPVSLYRFHRHQMTRDSRQMTTATFAVLNNFFAQPNLPTDWLAMKDHAFSSAHLRAAAQAYRIEDYEDGRYNLARAITLNPALLTDDGAQLAGKFRGWTELPKIGDPLAYLAGIYANLPDELVTVLHGRRGQELGQMALDVALVAWQAGEREKAQTAVRQAIRHNLRYLTNRGALSILLRSL